MAIDDKMMKEIKSLKSNLKPQETLFVVDSMIGQDAVLTAKILSMLLTMMELYLLNWMEIQEVVQHCQ